MSTDLTGLIPHGWSGGEAVTKWWRGKFIHLYRLRKNCAQCGKEMTLDVTKAAIAGEAKNAGLLLRNCPTCRGLRKAGGPGSRGGKSRPTAESLPPIATGAPGSELERLGMMISTMREELAGLYDQLRDARERLAKYELPAAMAAISERKMPWDVQ